MQLSWWGFSNNIYKSKMNAIMKQLLTIFLLAFALSTTAQTKADHALQVDTSVTPYFKMIVGDMGNIYATIDHNDKLVVNDSLQAIKKLIEISQKCNQRQSRDFYAHEILQW